jgi:apolipoprotein N-acyltransferase
MSVIGLIMGIISFFWLGISILPLLGWLNWLNIPFAAVGLIFGLIGYSRNRNGMGTAAIILNTVAIVLGIIRLSIGGGFF